MPIYGKDPPTSPPILEEDGTSALDSRYHVTFSDSPDAATEVERLGLLLSDSGGRLAFNVQHSSPFGGMLGGGGSPTDRDLSRYTVRSQADWRGGRGLLTSYEDTNRFHDGEADTRFPGKIMLSPARVDIPVTTSDAPQNVPAVAATPTIGNAYAKWDSNGLVYLAQYASAAHAQVAGDPRHQNIDPTGSAEMRVNLPKAQSFVSLNAVSVASVTVFVSILEGHTDPGIAVVIKSGSAGGSQVGGTASTGNPGLPTNGTMVERVLTFPAPISLSAGVRYWLEFSCTQESYRLHFNTGYTYGTAWDYFAGTGWLENLFNDFCFKINNGSASTDGPETRVKVATPFTMPASTLALTSINLYLGASAWGSGPVARVRIFKDSGGSPATTQMSIGTLNDPGSALGWVNIPMSAYTLEASTAYWIELEITAATGGSDATVEWGGSNPDPDTLLAKTNAYTVAGGYAGWVASASRLYFKINDHTTTEAPYWTPYTYNIRALGQSFTAPAVALAITKIQMFAKRASWDGSPTLTLELYTGATEPTTLVATGSTISASTFADVLSVAGWLTLPISFTTVAGTKYWIVLTPAAPTEADRVWIDWYGDLTDTYADGTSIRRDTANYVVGSWTTPVSNDRYFKINNGLGGLTSVTVAPLRFENKWYAAAGVEVLRFNTSTGKFDQVASLAQVVTSLAAFNGKIYAAQGDATQIQESANGDSGSWSPVSGGGATHAFTHLRAYNGYLYTVKAFGGEGSLDYFNGDTWNSEVAGAGQIITVATPDVALTGVVGFQNEIIITAATGMYSLSSSFVYQIIDYSNEQFQDNGKNALTWMADGRLYTPVAQSLHAYDGTRLTPVGLDLDDGLPVGEQGHVSALVGSRSFMFAAVDAGASGRSGIYAFNGVGWHCLRKASAVGARIRALGLEQATSSSSRPRLWYWEDGTPYYMEFPDLTDLPAGYASSRYAQTGFVESVWLGGELSLIPKDFTSIIVRSTGCAEGVAQISVYAEIDRSGVLFPVGNILHSPHQELQLLAATFEPTTTADGSTDEIIQTVEEGGLRVYPGEFVRIGSEVAQVLSTAKSAITLVTPLSAAPAAGETIYPARPSGFEIRYKLVLESFDLTVTPVVNRVSLKWGELLLDKRRVTMTVRVEDGMKLRGSNAIAYPYSAASLRTKLREWMRRTSPFYITDPTGDRFLVKIVSANETSFAEENSNIGTMWSSRLSLTLDEV